MIKFKSGFEVEGEVSITSINFNNKWQSVIIILAVTDLTYLFEENTTFEYGGFIYEHDGILRKNSDGCWLAFKNRELIIDEITPLKEDVNELKQQQEATNAAILQLLMEGMM